MKKRIIIIGGGFSGVACARELLKRQKSNEELDLVLFSRENHMIFTPLLADCVGASLHSSDVMVPLRQMLPGVHCRTEEVREIDPDRRRVHFFTRDRDCQALSYDELVISSGSIANLSAVPGMVDHAFPLKPVGDAEDLRRHILTQLELAQLTSNEEERKWLLSFIIVGGGYSGVESAGEINDLVRGSLKYFTELKQARPRIMLVHSREQILPEIGEKLREFARKKMQQAGVELHLQQRAKMVTAFCNLGSWKI